MVLGRHLMGINKLEEVMEFEYQSRLPTKMIYVMALRSLRILFLLHVYCFIAISHLLEFASAVVLHMKHQSMHFGHAVLIKMYRSR